MPRRLSLASLYSLPQGVERPAYDPAGIAVGIVHLGLGAFHRAHQAMYTDAVMRGDPRWGICGVSLKTSRATQPLKAQDGLYTALEKSPAGNRARVIGAVREAVFLGAERAQVMARLADPGVHIVSLTVTEKGYCHDPATGHLNVAHPDIVHDLAHSAEAASAPGLVVAGLAARRAAGVGPLTVVCCDNLPHNGRVVGSIVAAYAQAHDPALAEWIGRNVTFPSTMVDRIVPATTDADVAEVAALLGVADAAPVVFEPFKQWVIEDAFAAPRPRWEDAGAQFVADVAPFETMKLRLLNGSHSTLAYLGFLAGHDYIWQASSDPDLARLVLRQMAEEIVPTLAAPPGVDLAAYCAQLMTRFRNPALPHRTQQIAMDGSQKLPQRLLGTIRDRKAAGAPIAHLPLAVAGWIRYASGVDEQGKPIAVSDPLAPTFARIAAHAAGDPARIAAGFLDLAQVFGADLVADAAFRASVTGDVVALFRNGVRRTLAAHLAKG
ncbi:MAG: mannitol dehydrogenase family protein [Betaproteobacteria bacterium]